ncbi:MAG: hypothetical protein MRZ32_00440 [Bacteroidales bacterium]|nr:hypothetical protein [Bacteroidales bacterium]MDY2916957.1 hypothetical protein [Muribaculaceae bacterium]
MEYDEQKAIQYIRDHSEGHANYDDDQLLNVIDMIFDYYDEHGLLDIDVDADGNSDDDDDNEEAALIEYVSRMLAKDKGAIISPDDVPYIVRGELGYEEYLDQNLM